MNGKFTVNKKPPEYMNFTVQSEKSKVVSSLDKWPTWYGTIIVIVVSMCRSWESIVKILVTLR